MYDTICFLLKIELKNELGKILLFLAILLAATWVDNYKEQ